MIHFVCNSKGHLEVPQKCSNSIAVLMNQCWRYHPEDRPSFATLLNTVEELLHYLQEANSTKDCNYAMMAEKVYADLNFPTEPEKC